MQLTINILLLVASFFWLRRFVFKTITLLHIFQLEGYRNKGFIKWIIKNPKKGFDEESFVTGTSLLFIGLFLESFRIAIIFSILWILVGIWIFKRSIRKKQKKPLVWTARSKRLFSLSILLCLFIMGIVFYFTYSFSVLIFFLTSQVILQLSFINLILANILAFPLETSINFYYLTKAKKRIRKQRPKVIGIAGSYGKTSVKHIIGKILSKKYNTLITQEGYNTLMGICKVINNELLSEHQIFVVEMGAYKRGDIKELCRLVKPEIGVLTGIGPQHLERFGSIKNIKLAKFEIIENLPPFGVAIINNDDEVCKGLMDKIRIKRVGYGIEESQKSKVKGQRCGEDLIEIGNWKLEIGNIIAEDVEVDSDGIRFKVKGEVFKTKLLGRHNVLNILAGIAVGLELKIEIGKIREAIEELNFIPHRLSLIKNLAGAWVLDDAYNSNPVGAAEALFTLSKFEKRRKILITPGMIELGEIEYEENKKFGKKAAKTCDIVILVGQKRTEPIFDGLREEGFLEKNIIVVNNFKSARKELEGIITSNDIVLFENDLPDTYDED